MRAGRPRFWVWMAFVLTAIAGNACAQTIFVNDTFTTGVNQTLEAHTPNTGGAWTRVLGGSSIQIAATSDDIRPGANDDWEIYTNGATPPATEYVIGLTFTFTAASTDNWVDVFGRGNVVSGSGYLARVTSTGVVALIGFSGGTGTVLATTTITITLNAPHTLILSIRNSAKEVYVDGTLRASSTDNTVTGVGIVGLAMSRNGAGQSRGDNYFAATFAPTEARMFETDVVRDEQGRALVTWSTAGEKQNLGFRVHRLGSRGLECLTPTLIAGSAFLAGTATLTAGNAYRWIDEAAPADAVYWIEEIDTQQRRSWHGPLVPHDGTIEDHFARSRFVTELHHRDVRRERSRVAAQHEGTPHKRRSASPYRANAQQLLLAGRAAINISVETEGWYRLPAPDGDRQKLALYEDGVEIAMLIETDEILFYGRPLDSPWSAARTYWLVSADNAGRRVSRALPANTTNEQTFYSATVERRDKAIFFASLRRDDGDGFVGPVISTDPAAPTLQEVALSAVVPGRDATLEVTIQGGTSTSDLGHRVSISFNGAALGVVELDGQERAVARFAVPASAVREGANGIGFVSLNGADDISAIEAVRVTYDRRYRAKEGRLTMTVEGGRRARLEGFGSAARVFDITDRTAPQELEILRDGDDLWAAPRGAGTRVLIAQNGFETPARVEANEPSSLHESFGAEVLIVAHPSLAAAVEPLRAHRLGRGLRSIVAKTDDVYDEFSFGVKDPAAIRALIATSQSWSIPPRWVLLVGDATFDSRDYVGGGAFDLLPTRLIVTSLLRTASDSWFTDFDGDGKSEVAIGRLPARTAEQAAAMVAKIIAYETAPLAGDWNRRAVLVAGNDATLDFLSHVAAVSDELPPHLTTTLIDAQTSGTAAARQQLLQQLDAGAMFVYYSGHGSVEVWGAPPLLTRNDAAALRNGSRLPLVVALTCLNGYFHDLYTDSLAEALLRAPDGGAVAVWGSSALTDPIAQDIAGEALMRALLASGTSVTLGEATLAAQRAANVPDVRRTFLLFGDPAMKLRMAQ